MTKDNTENKSAYPNRSLGESVDYNSMSKAEKKAYDAGKWDGLEKRKKITNAKARKKAVKSISRRYDDKMEYLSYYVCVLTALISLFGLLAAAAIYEGVF